jgi:hypothetical protein
MQQLSFWSNVPLTPFLAVIARSVATLGSSPWAGAAISWKRRALGGLPRRYAPRNDKGRMPSALSNAEMRTAGTDASIAQRGIGRTIYVCGWVRP